MDASEVYDRQIRLWGLEAQRRMQEARVLFVGLRALQAEICKNVVLAGINVALLDHRPVAPQDLAAQFFLRQDDVGKNRAEACLPRVQEMNPLAKVECHTQDPATLPDDFFAQFDVVVASDLPPSQLVRLDKACRGVGKAFMHADCFGRHGLCFVDLGPDFKGREDPQQSSSGSGGGGGGDARPKAPKEFALSFPTLEETLAFRWAEAKGRWALPKPYAMGRLLGMFEEAHGGRRPSPIASPDTFEQDAAALVALAKEAFPVNGLEADYMSENELRELAAAASAELSPVCAVVGGIMGQEILKAISRKGLPACNCFVWDGDSHEGRVMRVPAAPKAQQ